MRKIKIFLFIVLCVLSINAIGQGTSCDIADPFCTGTTYNFPMATDNGTAQVGPQYGCLCTQPNPVWYYLLISQAGNLTIDISSSCGDVDFAAWGPFSSTTCSSSDLTAAGNPGCGGNYTMPYGNMTDCAYSTAAAEQFNISSALVGQYYMLMLNNFANCAGNLTFSQTGGTGATNCAIVYCNITSVTATPGACIPGNTFTLTGCVNYNNNVNDHPPVNGVLTVTVNPGGYTQTFVPPFGTQKCFSIAGIPANGGAYTVTATFSAAPPCTWTTNFTAPAACNACSVDAGVDQTVCGLTATLAAGTTAGYSAYHWNPVAGITFGNINSASSTITASAPGTYTLTWVGTNSSSVTCTNDMNITFANPLAGFTYNSNQCLTGNSFNFTNTGTAAGATYSWTFAGGTPATSAAQNPSGVTFSTSGTHAVTQVVTIGTCTATYTQNITVYPQPTVTATPTNATCFGICNGSATAVGGSGAAPYTYHWNTGPNVATISSLCPGTYLVTVTDNLGCTGTGSATITQPAALTLNATRTNPTCSGACNGTANVTVTGGIGPFSYVWTGPIASQSISSLCVGTYTVTVTDNASAGCTQTASVVLTAPAPIVLTGSSVPATCGMSNGTATVNITSGGLPNYNYNWTGGSSTIGSASATNTISGLAAGAYTVTVTNSNGCTNTTTINVGSSGAPTATITASTNPNCFGQCNGTATVSLGGTLNPPYNYVWSTTSSTMGSALTTNTASNLCNGNSSVTITDNLGCSAVASVTVTQPSAVTAVASTVTAHCGHADGSGTITAGGGTPGYSYAWPASAGSQITATATNLPTGSYVVTVTDSHGCSTTVTATVPTVAGVVASISGITNVSCSGGNNGTATALGTGGNGPYTYLWPASAGSQVAATAINLPAGAYVVTITDANLCTSIASATIIAPSPVTASISGFTNALCNGVCNGTATVTAGGGTPAYTYSWTNSQTIPNATGLCNGVYSVTVRDINLCSATASVTITQPTVVGSSTTTVSADCGHADGSATVTGTGGTPGYTYLWSGGGQVTQTATNLIPGSYTVTVTDLNGCTSIASATIGNIPGGTASISSFTNVTCSGLCNGSATSSMGGGTMPYTYSWSGGGGAASTATNLCAGSYVVTITDANLCTSTATATITSPTPLTVNLTVNDVNCAGQCTGIITAAPSGGTSPYTYMWTNPFTGTVNNNLCAGSYTVTVTDANLCTVTATNSITNVPPIVLSAVPTSANCNQSNGALDLTVTNGAVPFTFNWSPAGITEDLVNIPAGVYNVTVTDTKGCTQIGSYTVPNVSGPVASITSFTNVTCNGLTNGMAQGTVTGGTSPYIYLWSNAQVSPTATNLAAGTYTFSATDAMGCLTTSTVTITQPPVLSILTLTSTNPACNGDCNGTSTVLPTGGTTPYTYLWVGGTPFGGLNASSATTTGICSGNLTVLITDANGCTVTGSSTIVEPTFITLTTAHTNETCSGSLDGTATVNVVGGSPPYLYQWDALAGGQANSTAIGLAGGVYTVTVTDSHNCTETTTVTVSTPNPMVFSSVVPTDLTCYLANNGSISTNVTGGSPSYTYNWTNSVGTYSANTQNIGNLAQETYFLTVTDQNGCFITTSVIISQPPQLSINLVKTDESCFQFCDGSITSNVFGGQLPYAYLWSNIEFTSSINNLCPGNYTVTVTDDNGCTITSNATVTGNALLQIDVLSVVPASCGVANGEATIGFQGGATGYTISWSTGGNSFHETDMPAGNATVTLIDQNGCIATQQIAIQNLAGPQITTLVSAPVSCAGMNDGVAIVGYTPSNPPAPPYVTTWSTTPVQHTDTASGLAGGTYYVTVVDANGCQNSGNVVVLEPTNFVSIVGNVSHNHCFGDCEGTASVLAAGGTVPYTYTWLGIGQNQASAVNLCAGPFTVVAEDAHGCTSVNTVTINQPTQVNITGVVTDALCNGEANGMISITASGGSPVYQYTWQFPATGSSSIASNLLAGAYSVVVTDTWSCTATASFTVDEPTPIYLYSSMTPAHCGIDNGTATIDSITGGTPGYAYVWSPGNLTSQTISNLSPGIYQLQVTDDHGCGGVINVNVTEIAPPSQVTIAVTNATCYNTFTGSATATVTGGLAPYTYAWSNLQTTQTAINLQAGVYTVTVTDGNSCTIIKATIVSQPNPVVIFTNGDTTICMGSSTVNITANAAGGTPPYTYLWTDTTFTTPTDQNQLVSPDSLTNYYVSAYDVNGCSSGAPGMVSVNVYQPISVNISSDAVICEGDNYNIIVGAQGGMAPYTYVWNFGSGNPNIVTPFDTTTYTVQVYDACGTPSTSASMTIFVQQAPHLVRDPRFQRGCVPYLADFDCIAYIPSGGITYSWNFGDPSTGSLNHSNDTTPSHLYSLANSYDITLTLTSDYGCDYTQTFNDLVIVDPVPTADFYYSPVENIDALNGQVHFYAQTDPSNDVTWYFENGFNSASGIMDPVYMYTYPGIYEVLLVVSSEGCIDTVIKTIKVNDVYTIWVPTAFYPGTGAGLGYFYPKGKGFDPTNYYLAIYDRWGALIFETTEYPEGTDLNPVDVRNKANADLSWIPGGWNGGKNNDINRIVPIGTYTWYIKVKDVNGNLHEETGPVTVIR